MQTLTHYFLHLGFPLLLAVLFFKKDWKMVYIIFLATMVIDLDHLLATPVYEANRCSIGIHPLHSYFAITVYSVLLFMRKPFNIIAIGLLLHVFTDFIICMFVFLDDFNSFLTISNKFLC